MRIVLLSVLLTAAAALILYCAALISALAPCYGRLAYCP